MPLIDRSPFRAIAVPPKLALIALIALLSVLSVLAAGCLPAANSADGRTDEAAPAQDAGSERDAGLELGGGSSEDGGRSGDAGASVDAGGPVGQPVPGCADVSDPSLSASERVLLGLPGDSWYSAPDTKLYDLCKSAATYGDGVYLTSGCSAVVDAWSSGAFDSQRQKMMVWGGGHNDYGGNEVYAFNLKTFAWEQLTQPSRPPFNKDPLDDGKPVSRHTYDGVEFISHRGTMLGFGGSRSTDGNGTRLTWEFKPDALTWTNLNPTAPRMPSDYDFGLAYDASTQKVFVHSHALLNSYDFTLNKWTALKDFGYPPYTGKFDLWKTRTGAVDPKRGLFVTLGGGAPLMAYEIATDTVLSLTAPWNAVTGGTTELSRPAPGLDFDPATEQLVAWSGGAPVALDGATHQWVARSAVGAPLTQVGSGTYGRWRYVERYNVFTLVNSARENVLFYKHTPGCGR